MRRKIKKGCELGEDSIWQGGQSVFVEVMKGNESVMMNEMSMERELRLILL